MKAFERWYKVEDPRHNCNMEMCKTTEDFVPFSISQTAKWNIFTWIHQEDIFLRNTPDLQI